MSEFKSDPAIKKALGSGPRVYAMLALAFIEKWGDEAKELIYKTFYEASYAKGKAMAKLAKDTTDLREFERLQIEKLRAKGFNTPGYDDPARHWTERTKKKCVFDIEPAGGCEIGIPEVWKEMGLDDDTICMLGELRCVPSDTGTRHGFNENIDFKFTKLAPRGDGACEWTEELKD